MNQTNSINQTFSVINPINQFDPNVLSYFNEFGFENGICGQLCMVFTHKINNYFNELITLKNINEVETKLKNILLINSEEIINYMKNKLPICFNYKQPLHIQEISNLLKTYDFNNIYFIRYNNFKNLDEQYHKYLDSMDMETMLIDKNIECEYYVEKIVDNLSVYLQTNNISKESYGFIFDLNGHYMCGLKILNHVIFIETTDKDYNNLKINKLKSVFEF